MEPKFQSSFIPKGPLSTSSSIARTEPRHKSLLGLLATLIFAMAVAASLGVFGYNKYLSYQIGKMGSDLEIAKANIQAESINELVRLDSRINSTETLLNQHTLLTPLLDLIESNTVTSVRFTSFNLLPTDQGLVLSMEGEGRTYTSIALQAKAFTESKYLKNPAFSNLNLDELGNVEFQFSAIVDPVLISYQRNIEQDATSSPRATSTSAVASSTPVSLPSSSTSTTSR